MRPPPRLGPLRAAVAVVLAGAAFLLGACGGSTRPESPPAAAPQAAAGAAIAPRGARGIAPEHAAAEVAVARAGCLRCHAADDAARERFALPRGPRLEDALGWHAADAGRELLRRHHGGDDADALAAWLQELGADARPAVEPALTEPGAAARGERLVSELACHTCHTPAAFAALPARTDHERLATFLAQPAAHRPALAHVPLTPREANDVAAWLLRAQEVVAPPQPGVAWTAWQLRVRTAGPPELAGRAPVARGVAAAIDLSMAPRDEHYVLRFDALLDVPRDGAWTFATDSDDSSWLWLDGERIVTNEGLAPRRRREGTVTLTAGRHTLSVLYTQAAGGASLAVRWRGPGDDEERDLPPAALTTHHALLVPPAASAPPAPELVARGRAAARARRCDACHDVADAAFAALPAPAPAPRWAALGDGPCPQSPAGLGLRAAVAAADAAPRDAAAELASALLRDGCTSCHARDGRGGLPPAVRAHLAEVEDLGDEGRLPPDLTGVGRRLRPEWLARVVADGHAVRPYVRVRMPAFGAAAGARYAQWFAAVDGSDPRAEPPFSLAAAQRGRQLAGLGGRNCITCHAFQGLPSLGPQGMDLAIQHERLLPGWFHDWLLQPDVLRPGTRMPALWLRHDDLARAEIDAIRTWLSLGAAAPLPPGAKAANDSLLLVAGARPRLHGAFLRGVSARCLAVGTAERVHFAFDLATPRLVWLWRGDFLDASGTWSGRAGKLLEPAGTDWRVLRDATIADGAPRRLLGQRRTADGYPVLRVAAGDVEYEDEARPRFAGERAEVVRTLRALRGELVVGFPPAPDDLKVLIDGAPAARHRVAAGAALEVLYRW